MARQKEFVDPNFLTKFYIIASNDTKKGGVIMASNFKICVYQGKNNLTLKLMGSFDQTLVNKLINVMKRKCHGISEVFIHDNGKKHVYPFGIEKI